MEAIQHKFSNGLSIGKIAENYTIDLYREKYKQYNPVFDTSNQGKKYDWSIELADGTIGKFEVKHDIGTYTTGNVALEFRCNKRDSGFMSSKADYFLYVFYNGVLRVRTETLRTYFEDNYDRLTFSLGIGDGGRADIILFEKEKFFALGKFIDTYTLEQYYDNMLSKINLSALQDGDRKYLDVILKDLGKL